MSPVNKPRLITRSILLTSRWASLVGGYYDGREEVDSGHIRGAGVLSSCEAAGSGRRPNMANKQAQSSSTSFPPFPFLKYIEHSSIGNSNFIRTIYHHAVYTAAPGVRNLNDDTRSTTKDNRTAVVCSCVGLMHGWEFPRDQPSLHLAL